MARTIAVLFAMFGFTTACGPSQQSQKTASGVGNSGSGDSGPVAGSGPDTGLAGASGPDEVCNGIDDDGDGAIDEGHPDADGDGVADCVDTTCGVETTDAAPIPVDATCSEPVVDVPLELDVEWQWTGSPSWPDDNKIYTTPLVGLLDDSNEDGTIDTLDHPTIVITASAGYGIPGRIVALDGVTQQELWTVPGRYPSGDMVLADVDADGRTDVVYVDMDYHVVALRGDGQFLWRSDTEVAFMFMFAPTLTAADLDQDGQPEVVAMNLILNGTTGEVIENTQGAQNWALSFWAPWAADLDRDGDVELVLGDVVYGPDGTRIWTADIGHMNGCWSGPLDVDGDGDGEVVMLCGDQMAIYEADGSKVQQAALPDDLPGPYCAGDFDGDGMPELAFVMRQEFFMMELDGTIRWSRSVLDGVMELVIMGGCTAFDVDRNGTDDVIYADETELFLFDGSTGATLYSRPEHGGPTGQEYPVIADVDLDGQAELLLASSDRPGAWAGLTVLGHRHDVWPSPGSTWHNHARASTGIEPDGTVTPTPTPSWQVENTFRARTVDGPAPVNLRPRVVETCAASCAPDGAVEISVVIENDSGMDVVDPIVVSLWVERDGMRTALAEQTVSGGVLQGTATASVVFTTTTATVEDADLVVQVGFEPGVNGVFECDLDDNEWTWRASVCP